MTFETPYLDAIQAIPGDTPSEKYRWIANIIKNRMKAGGEPSEINTWKDVPQPLVPLFEIEAGKMLKNYDAVTEALKSDDSIIVSRALKARWYFDGRNKEIVNVNYFFRNIFPYVSLETRKRIIKNLSRYLAGKEPKLAEEFFQALSNTYGTSHAVIRLLNACSESFAYEAIIRRKIVLDETMLTNLYVTAPNLVINYLKLDQPNEDPLVRNCHKVDVYKYTDFLPKLIKKNLDTFIEICEKFPHPPALKLSNKCAMIFLKNAKEQFQAKPKLFIKMLPLKLIDANKLEVIFPKLFPENIEKFYTDDMLLYLKYYPEEKQASLLLQAYRQAYGKNLLDNFENITNNLLQILPDKQRIELVRLLLANKSNVPKLNHTIDLRCYLPANEVIPAIKKDISTAKLNTDRIRLVLQMITTCKINHDEDALLEVLSYCNSRHKNEEMFFWDRFYYKLMEIYDIENLSEKHWNVIDEIFLRNYVKNLKSHHDAVNRRFVEKALHYRLKNNLPIDKMIKVFVNSLWGSTWNQFDCEKWSFLRDNFDYELKCFKACLEAIKDISESNTEKWIESRISVANNLLMEIYDYNKRHVKPNTRREKLSLKNFPWLMEVVKSILTDESNENLKTDIISNLRMNEKDLYDAWVFSKLTTFDVSSGEALAQMKKDPKSILDHWEDYLKNCESACYNGNIKRFLLSSRWFKDIPIKFAHEAMKQLHTNNKSSYLQLLGTLLYGTTFAKLIQPYIPTDKTIDAKNENAARNYNMLEYALSGMRISNPPVPVELVGILCEGDYLSLALQVITNVSNRTPLPKIKAFANDLTDQRVSVRKHGIRLICAIQTLQESVDFLLSQLKKEEHYSIREVIFQKIYQFLQKEPGPVTWSAFKECVSALKVKDWAAVKDQLLPSSEIPTEYIYDLIRLILQTTDNFVKEGLEEEEMIDYLSNVFGRIDEGIANVLPDEFCEEIIEKYLVHPTPGQLGNCIQNFLLHKYLFLRKDKIDTRIAALSRFFMNAVKNGWDVPHPKKKHFYPVNYTISTTLNDIVKILLIKKDIDPRVIDGVLSFFTVFLTPEMDITSYFLLILAKEYLESSTPKEFAWRFSQKLPELIQKHTPYHPSCIIEALEDFFLMLNTNNVEEVKLTVIETLLECSSTYAHLVAVSSLPIVETAANVARYDALVDKFRKHDNPAIKSILYTKINRATFYYCTVDP